MSRFKITKKEAIQRQEQNSKQDTGEQKINKILDLYHKADKPLQYAIEKGLAHFAGKNFTSEQLQAFTCECIGEYKACDKISDILDKAITDDFFEVHVRLEEIITVIRSVECLCESHSDLNIIQNHILDLHRIIERLVDAATDELNRGEDKLTAIRCKNIA